MRSNYTNTSLLAASLCAVLSCTHPTVTSMPKEIPGLNETPFRFITEERPSCLGMVKNFCKSLYSPGNLGKLEIPLPTETFEIRRGKTDNDFSQVYYEYAQTQLRHRHKLPPQFQTILNQRGYFDKLRAYLARKPRKEMSVEDRVSVLRLSSEIDSIWLGAINETVLKRMERKFEGFSRMSEENIPVELLNEGKRTRSYLTSEISRAIWSDHPNWMRVERTFEKVKNAYRSYIASHETLSEEIKNDWLERLSDLELLLPGGDPEVDMTECSRTEENAYYYAKRNYVTVCAGDFNAEDITQTLTHEVAHALDVNRSLVMHEANSQLGKQLEGLRQLSCSDKKVSCRDWELFKGGLSKKAEELAAFQPQLPEFNSCLKPRPTKGAMNQSYIDRVASDEVQDAVSSLAENHVFLRMITPELPMLDGTQRKNPAYLNPCGYYLWDKIVPPYSEDLTLLMFFTNEYQCTKDVPPIDRFQNAIEVAKTLQTEIVTARLKAEGEYSPRWRLNADGYAAPPGEKFADALGEVIFAKLLQKEPLIAKRRASYLANSAWLCSKPSLRHLFPAEAAVLKKYYAEPHSENTIRQQELLSADIRQSLECDLDFEPKECKL